MSEQVRYTPPDVRRQSSSTVRKGELNTRLYVERYGNSLASPEFQFADSALNWLFFGSAEIGHLTRFGLTSDDVVAQWSEDISAGRLPNTDLHGKERTFNTMEEVERHLQWFIGYEGLKELRTLYKQVCSHNKGTKRNYGA